MPTLGRIALIGSLVAALSLAATEVAGANGGSQEPPNGSGNRSLAGEEFLVQDVTLSFDCDPTRVSTVHYTASGPATGPYPGTFTVEGTITIEPQTLPGPRTGTVAGPIATLEESFTIDSPVGTVTGTKSLPPDLPFDNSQGSCQQVNDFEPGGPISAADGTVVDIFSEPTYEATIQESYESFSDQGDALLSISELDLIGTCVLGTCPFRQASFSQGFLGSTSVPEDGEDEDDEDDDEDDDEEDDDDDEDDDVTGDDD